MLRASSDKAKYPVLDNYAVPTTSPIYVTMAAKPALPRRKIFSAWIITCRCNVQYPDWNSPEEKERVLQSCATRSKSSKRCAMPVLELTRTTSEGF